MTIQADLDTIVFMKVGLHAGETFEHILERKQREYERAGRIFWGYGGGTMHPTQKVQPFVRMHLRQGHNIRLVMQEIDSKHPNTEVYATHFSKDGQTWERMPEGVQVRGSRYALVLNQIEEGELDLNLGEYQVGVGPSAGKPAAGYIQGRVDKGCLERIGAGSEANPAGGAASAGVITAEPKIVKVRHSALLQEPYAVLLKSEA